MIRGKVVAINNAMITIGQLFSVILVFLIKPHWRTMLGLAGVPSFIQGVGMICLPESPRWLGKVGQADRSRGVLHRIYLDEYVEDQDRHLQKEIDGLKIET